MDYEWDPDKAQSNRQKHGMRFADTITVLEDPFALTILDNHTDEERFVTVRPATKRERRRYQEGINDDE